MGVEGKRLLVLGAGRGQIGLYKAAKEMGITTIAGTMPDNNPPGIPLADEVCFMNIANPDEVAKKAAKLKLDGVATCCLDTGISALGKTCDSLGLTGLPEKAAIMCNDKSKMKKAFMEYGVSTAQYFEISSEEELKNALDKIKLPVIIKATDLQGSNGIYIAKTEKDNKIISRAHRYDLYEEFRKNKYIPCRELLIKNLDAVYPCSEDGTCYLQSRFPKYKNKIKTRFLGTLGCGQKKYNKEDELRIVSCSNVVPVKRLDLIVETLQHILDINIKWTHFGDGIMMNQIKEMSRELPENIKIDFRGNVKNSDLLEVYKNNQFDLFLNVSLSEGIPVSIMEALSFGIPCIATDVGGTKEIVIDGYNGWLLKKDFKEEQLVNIIRNYCNLNNEQILKLRECAYESWKEKYNAKKNYTTFVDKLQKI